MFSIVLNKYCLLSEKHVFITQCNGLRAPMLYKPRNFIFMQILRIRTVFAYYSFLCLSCRMYIYNLAEIYNILHCTRSQVYKSAIKRVGYLSTKPSALGRHFWHCYSQHSGFFVDEICIEMITCHHPSP